MPNLKQMVRLVFSINLLSALSRGHKEVHPSKRFLAIRRRSRRFAITSGIVTPPAKSFSLKFGRN